MRIFIGRRILFKCTVRAFRFAEIFGGSGRLQTGTSGKVAL
jgi:hypothetical protein